MSLDCYIVIGILCLFQSLDILQLRQITNILKNRKDE